ETLKIYPFDFRLEITYHLSGTTLEIIHKVLNPAEKPMYFSIGAHPAFNIPLYENEDYEDHYLELDRKLDLETDLLTGDGLISSRTKTMTQNESQIKLQEGLVNKDALIFRNIPSKVVSLVNKSSGKILSVEYDDFNDLGIWAKAGAPFVCIEPWLGHADME